MSALPHNIAILALDQKCELLDAIWEDNEVHAATMSTEQAAELDRRLTRYAHQPLVAIPWELVKADKF